MSNNDKVFSCIGLLALFIISLVVAAVMNGWALSLLWSWFFVPIFEVPQLRVIDAIGVSMVVTFLTQRVSQSDSNKNSGWLERLSVGLFVAIFYPVMAVFFGWIVLQFI